MKKILIIDDSALMRRVMSDIIDATNEYRVSYTASNGLEGLEILEKNPDISAVISDINMPYMNGLDFLRAVNERQMITPVIVFSSSEDTKETITALELGAIEFIKKPESVFGKKNAVFLDRVCKALKIAVDLEEKRRKRLSARTVERKREKTVRIPVPEDKPLLKRKKLVALVCSTGGPKALQAVISKLPKNLAAPVLVVQHMPAGFTKSLASRLDELSEISVKEAEEGEKLENGVVYIAKGGTHLTVNEENNQRRIFFDDSPPVVGLKPCGNIMYRSLCGLSYDEIICVVLTGMGADGTKGIRELSQHAKTYVIAQDEASSTVYGMPRSVYEQGLADVVLDLNKIADEIVQKTGVT